MFKLLFRAGVIFLFALTFSTKSSAVTYYTYTNAGNNGPWNVAATWTTDPSGTSLVGSAVPGNNDVVHILNGFTVFLTANVSTTGLTININNGGTLDLVTFTLAILNNLSGSGTLKIKAGYFPAITTNNFVTASASGATVEFYDFTGLLPVSINYPNLTFTNTTGTDHTITFSNSLAYSLTVFGNFITQTTSTGSLNVTLGNQATHGINASIRGDLTIGSGTTFSTGVFNVIHAISLHGNMTNNGTVDLSNSAQYTTSTSGAATVTFTGAADKILACNGVTDFYTLTVDKGLSSTNILSVTSTSTANFNLYGSGKLLTVTNGTIKLGANIMISRLYSNGSTNYDLGSTTTSPMMWIDGATIDTHRSALVVYGKFRITNGSFTCVGAEGSVIREEGEYMIEGGTFTTEKFRPSTTAATHRGSFTMTGGVFNTEGTSHSNGSYARFSLPYPEQVFIMSGGVINVSNPQAVGGIHIGCLPSNYNVTGGTFNAILSWTSSFFEISSTAPFWNLNISRTGGTPTTVRLDGIGSVPNTVTSAQPLVVLNDLTIDGTNNPVFDATGENVTVGGDFIINSGGTYTTGSNTTTFNGTTDQYITNNGTITSGFYNLTVDKSSGSAILDGSATTFDVSQTLRLLNGVLNDGGKTLRAAHNIENNAIHTGTGSITLNGVTTQTISGDGTGVFGNLTLDNPTTPGATLTSDVSISGTLTLAGTGNSLFDIGLYQLSLTSPSVTALRATGNPFSNVKMVRTMGLQSDRGLRKTFGNTSTFTYAFGVGTTYTPATIQFTVPPSTYGSVAIKPVSTRHPFITAGITNNLSYYWKVATTGFTGISAGSVSHNYRYTDGYVSSPADELNYVPARYNPATWTVINDPTRVDEATNTISFTGVDYIDGDYTAGIPASFGIVKIFYSKRNGNWNNVTAGVTPWSNVSHSGPDATVPPGPGDQVFIGDGAAFNHTVAITTNNQASGGLEINTGSTLDVGVSTGHNFGRLENIAISGSGLLRISSAGATAEFPAGDFGNFIRESGGTVEYYTTGSQDFTVPTISAGPTNLPLISYKNLILTPATGRFINMPNQNERIYGTMTIQGGSATGVVRLNSTNARTLTLEGDLLIKSGNLQFQNVTSQILDVAGNINIDAGAIFDIAGAGAAVTNLIYIGGSLLNNGTFDMSNASRVTNTTFIGTANTSITGTGVTTDFNILTVSKGTSQVPVLNVNATAFTLSGGSQPLVLNNGTFRLSSGQTVTISNGVSFPIVATARLSANGGTIQVAGGNGIDLLLAGTLEILNGTVNVGTGANDNSIEYAATGQPIITISGGSLNVQSQIRRSSSTTQGGLIYNQSGTGVVTVGISSAITNNRGVFEIINPGSSFTMTGGTLAVARTHSGSISDLYLQPTSYAVTGGTVEIGATGASQTIDINTTIPLYNLSVTGTTNTARIEFNTLVLRGSLAIAAGNVFSANSLNVSITGNFINENTDATTGISVGGYRAGSVSQTTTFNGIAGNQILSGVAGNLTNFANLVINNTFVGGNVALSANSNLRVNGTLILSSGILAGSTNTITAMGSVFNSSTHTSSGAGNLTLQGSSNQIVGGNGSGKFGNLTLSNAAGATFSANQEITGTLTFTNGSLFIGPYGLNLSNTSLTAIVGSTSSRYIVTSGSLSNAGLTKAFAASVVNGNFTYPIGVSGKYTPAEYTLSSGASAGTITVKPVNSKHPNATGAGTAFINYYWSVSHSALTFTSLTHRYTYVAADEQGTVADYRDARFQGGAWTVGIIAGNPDLGTRVITFTNTNVTGDYTTGEHTAFEDATLYTSQMDGIWESDVAWLPDPPGTNLGPPDGSFVIISEGHTITVTTNSNRMATLEVRGRLHLGTTNGHDFGTVTTSGAGERTIQIQSSIFPTGNFTAFTAANGGTVEYDGTVILPTQSTYNNLTFTSAGTKTLPNTDLTVNGNFTVNGGHVTNAVNNRNIELVNVTGDFINNSIFSTGTGSIIVGRDLINSGATATFTAGNGANGVRIARNLVNSSSATFLSGIDSIGVRGNLNNSATFSAAAGAIRVSGNLNNTAGTFTGSTGIVSVKGSLTNTATYSAGAGVTTVQGSYSNSGASAVHHGNNNSMAVTGNFSNTAGAVFNANTGSITLEGNWTNTASFNAGTGSVTFARATPQALTGATTFNHVLRTNGGSLTLNSNVTVAGTLTLQSGNIITGSNLISLINTSMQPVTSYSATSFIDGRLGISYADAAGTSRLFPVGSGGIYRPVTIQQTLASSLPVVTVEMVNTPPTGTVPATVIGISPTRYYAVGLTSGTMNGPLVTLSFNTNGVEDESVAVPGNLRIARATNPAGPWTDEGGAGVFSPAAPAGHATSGITSIVNPTFFTLASVDNVLPIMLKSFDATYKNDIVEINWTTATEKNNAYFTIERSANGWTYDSIFSVKGAGDSKTIRNYKEIDWDPLPGVSYYRLRQTDYDGQSTFSNVVRVENTGRKTSSVSVYPNPSMSGEDVFIKMVNDQSSLGQLMICNASGIIIYSGHVDFSYPINLRDLKFHYTLDKGIYLIKIIAAGLVDVKKIIIN